MKKSISLVLFLLLAGVLISGCSPNSQNTYGPAWDTSFSIPLAENESKDISKILDENVEQIEVPQKEAEIISFSKDLSSELDEPLKTFKYDDYLSQEQLETSETIGLPVLSTGDLDMQLDGVNKTFPLLEGEYNLYFSLGDFISDIAFDQVVFSGDSNTTNNVVNVTIDNSDNASDINNLSLQFYEVGTDKKLGNKITYDTIAAGSKKTKQWVLDGEELENKELKVMVNVESSSEAEVGINITPEVFEFTKVVNLSFPELSNFSYDVSLSELFPDYVQELKDTGAVDPINEVGFKGGYFGVSLSNIPEDISYTWQELKISNLVDEDNDGQINLTGDYSVLNLDKEIDSSLINMRLTLGLDNNTETITYDSTKSITGNIGFSGDEFGIDYVNVNLSSLDDNEFQIDNVELVDSIKELDIPDEFYNINLKDPSVLLSLKGIEGLQINLNNIYLKSYDESGQLIREVNMGNIGNITGKETTLSLLETEPDFLDMVQTKETDSIVLDGKIVAEGESVLLKDNTELGLNELKVDFPFEVSLKESITWKMDPIEIMSLSSQQMDLINKGIKNAKLKAKNISNDINIDLEVDFYLANIPNAVKMDKVEVKSNLYNKEAFKEIDLSQGSNINKEFVLTTEEAQIFTGDNVYFGVQITLPETADSETYSLKSGDSFKIGKIFTVITSKVNY